MKSLRARLTIWFAASLVLVLAVFVGFTYRLLDLELREKTWRRDYPDHPDWQLHGSYSEAEVRDVLQELVETSLLYGIPLALVTLLIGYWLASKSVRPIAEVNRQLREIRAPDLSRRIDSPELDAEFLDLVRQVNELLARLQRSFNEMSEYSAMVAHELRTPLAILRLKVEQAGDRMAPDLSEELQAELHQLAHVVDQSLMLAKAGQGRLVFHAASFDLADMVADIAEDFSLLAQEEGRAVKLVTISPAEVFADPKYVRQIVHNLFSNALKHGQGEIRVKLRPWRGTRRLTLTNRVRSWSPGPTEKTLGLGLRVVDTLLNLQSTLRCRRRRWLNAYSVAISLPALHNASVRPLSPTPMTTAAGQGN